MNKIAYVDTTTTSDAVKALGATAEILAGGTDILSRLKGMILPNPPLTLVNIKNIPNLAYIKEEGGMLKIGALTKLVDITESTVVQGNYLALAQAAGKVGGPQHRNMGTIAGNLCQEVRCWYYRSEHNAFNCFRKGGTVCFAVAGDNRYHAILGGSSCFAVCPSDTAIALSALNATIVTTKKSIAIKDLFKVLGNTLDNNEIITEIQVPTPSAGTKQAFVKFAQRKAIDFAIASAAAVLTVSAGNVTKASIVMGGVAPIPYRATDAETSITGKSITSDNADAAGAAAVKSAIPLSGNKYMVQVAKTMVKRAIINAGS
jgi:xanthine dehydrogenase YagS FAD-binding subunit